MATALKALYKTTKDGHARGRHYHVAYVNQETGVILVAPAKGHSHDARIDEQGGIYIGPDEGGTHIHAGLEPYEPKAPEKEDNETKVINEVYELLKTGRGIEHESAEAAIESEGFYDGSKQWPAGVKDKLESQDRAALTINKIVSKVDELSGYERQQRSDITYLPIEEGDAVVADVLTTVAKVILDNCNFNRERSEVFLDQVITGRGFFNCYVDREKDIRGEIKVERFPWSQVIMGPHQKLDGADCEYVIKHQMYSRGKLKQLFPDKAEDIDKDFSFLEQRGIGKEDKPDEYLRGDAAVPVSVSGLKIVDIAKKEFRLLECWRKIFERVSVAVYADDEFIQNLAGWDSKDIGAVKALGFEVVSKNQTRFRITRVAGSQLLSDENPADLPENEFFLIPAYAYKRGYKFWGKVELAKDAQLTVNKRFSQVEDIGNKMIAYGWFYDPETFIDSTEEDRFKQNSAKPGFTIKLQNSNKTPVKVEGIKMPTELVELLQLADTSISEAMNITVSPSHQADSGIALLHHQRIKLTGNEFIFDHLSGAVKEVGRRLISLIRRYYAPDRIIRILDNEAQKRQLELGGQPYEGIDQQALLEILEKEDLVRYDVSVSEVGSSPTTRMATFMLLKDLQAQGIPVPPEVLVGLFDHLSVREKQKILQSIQSQQEAAASEQQSLQAMEENKTLIARGVIPPSVQQRLQSEQQSMAESQGDGGPQGVAG